MKKITLQLFLVFATVFSYAQINLISNGTLDDATGWTVNNFYDGNSNGMVTFAGGNATWSQSAAFENRGIYQSVFLEIGTYQFDMDVTYGSDMVNAWGEVFVGSSEPVENNDYSDNQVLKIFNTWDCGTAAYSGLASASGCDTSTTPGEFTITTAGTYYLVIKIGDWDGGVGASGVEVDNITLYETASLSLEDFTANSLKLVYDKDLRSVKFFSNNLTDERSQIQVFDIMGKSIKTIENVNSINDIEIDFQSQNNGLYFVRIESGGKQLVKKVLIY